MVEAVPVVEIAHDTHMLRVRCPHGEAHPLNPVFGGRVGAEQVVGPDQIGGHQLLQVLVVEGQGKRHAASLRRSLAPGACPLCPVAHL